MLCKLNLIFLCFYFFISKQLIFAVWSYSGSFCCICVISNLSHNNTWIKCSSSNIVSRQVFLLCCILHPNTRKYTIVFYNCNVRFFCHVVSDKVAWVRIYSNQFCQWYVLLSYLPFSVSRLTKIKQKIKTLFTMCNVIHDFK